MTLAGFPHSEISGSTPVYDSPELIAVNHVLHRLLTPRHPSCALSSLTTNLLWLAPGLPKGTGTEWFHENSSVTRCHQNFATRRS